MGTWHVHVDGCAAANVIISGPEEKRDCVEIKKTLQRCYISEVQIWAKERQWTKSGLQSVTEML